MKAYNQCRSDERWPTIVVLNSHWCDAYRSGRTVHLLNCASS